MASPTWRVHISEGLFDHQLIRCRSTASILWFYRKKKAISAFTTASKAESTWVNSARIIIRTACSSNCNSCRGAAIWLAEETLISVSLAGPFIVKVWCGKISFTFQFKKRLMSRWRRESRLEAGRPPDPDYGTALLYFIANDGASHINLTSQIHATLES